MNVNLIRREAGRRMYEVDDGAKWWTASHNAVDGSWFVVNSRGTVLQDFGATWLRVVDACEDYDRKHEIAAA
jgi:hypothetical protein